ncbi:MAG: DUF2891 domain-containing protein [Chloroflexi bacterium]|nr:DUF2891 domain-containing protein [Chloroflexota bacterium]
MPDLPAWESLLRANAAAYARVAMANVDREFPSDVWQLVRGPGDLPRRPRERTPVFWGSFDWHSCVEMHWLLARLLCVVPDAIPVAEVRALLDRQLRPGPLAAEAAFIAHPDNRNRERPYGWGWALALVAELEAWDDPDGRRWAAAAAPLADAVAGNFLDWLPRATYPVRYGVHGNSAFGLGLALPWATTRAAIGAPALRDAIVAAARGWFGRDVDYPGGWEPSGFDFLSPALVEAELMSRLLDRGAFAAWLDAFLPGIAARRPAVLFEPAVVSDPTDGHIAHLHGLNLSRAWCWRRIAAALGPDDPRRPPALEAARLHAAAGLPVVVGDDYMVEHWLAAYAVLLLT